MPEDKNDEVTSEKTDEEVDINVEDNKDETEVVDDEKEEDVEDPHDKLLTQLQKDNKQKSFALTEKNRKIQELKKQLEEGGLDKDGIKEVIDEVVGEKFQSLKETQDKLDEALKIASDSNVDTLISKHAQNEGEKKIIKHFLENEANKTLPLEKQIEQATILARHAMSDEKFQKEVEKANQMAIKTSGKSKNQGEIPAHIQELADKLFQTKKGKEDFLKNYVK